MLEEEGRRKKGRLMWGRGEGETGGDGKSKLEVILLKMVYIVEMSF